MFDSGYILCVESNYKLSKKEQEKVEFYYEPDKPYSCYLSEWRCYYDKKENQTFDKKLMDIIDKEDDYIQENGYNFDTNGLSLQRLDPDDFLKDMSYYWG